MSILSSLVKDTYEDFYFSSYATADFSSIAALLTAKGIPHCSVLLEKIGTQTAFCIWTYTF